MRTGDSLTKSANDSLFPVPRTYVYIERYSIDIIYMSVVMEPRYTTSDLGFDGKTYLRESLVPRTQ